MAKEYMEKLCKLIAELEIENNVSVSLEPKHFFSGAALYANEIICASWSPVGLAFKLPDSEVCKLIESGEAKPLRYFDKGNVKKGYALFDNPEGKENENWKKYFLMAIEQSQ